jgi:hypothetical protein
MGEPVNNVLSGAFKKGDIKESVEPSYGLVSLGLAEYEVLEIGFRPAL